MNSNTIILSLLNKSTITFGKLVISHCEKFIRLIVISVVLVSFVSCDTDEPTIPTTNNEYSEQYRPQIHFSAKRNWINDPNGLVYFDGEYHLFYQHNPLGPEWGNMSWGHAISTDLIHWKQLNVALMPDDLGDIFSGCAVIDKNNTAGFGNNAMVAIYTSAGKVQSQSIAYSTDKGRTFTKYSANPVLANPGIADFRDPKVFWHNESNQWIMSLATNQTISFYGSANLKSWTRLSEFGNGIGSHGGVWECPDLFPLSTENGKKWVLLVSNSGAPNGGTGTQYFIGNFDGTNFTAEDAPYPLWLDYGKDNYAGVTWDNIPENDGRRLHIGWMNNWQYANNIPVFNIAPKGARGSMTLVRELKLGMHPEGYFLLKNKVVSEVESIANDWKTIVDEAFTSKTVALNTGNKKAYQLQLIGKTSDSETLSLKLSNSKNEFCSITIDARKLIFKRSDSGIVNFADAFSGNSESPVFGSTNPVLLDIYVDQSSVEIFVNDGTISLTNLVFPSSLYDVLTVESNNSHVNTKFRTFNSIWE